MSSEEECKSWNDNEDDDKSVCCCQCSVGQCPTPLDGWVCNQEAVCVCALLLPSATTVSSVKKKKKSKADCNVCMLSPLCCLSLSLDMPVSISVSSPLSLTAAAAVRQCLGGAALWVVVLCWNVERKKPKFQTSVGLPKVSMIDKAGAGALGSRHGKPYGNAITVPRWPTLRGDPSG